LRKAITVIGTAVAFASVGTSVAIAGGGNPSPSGTGPPSQRCQDQLTSGGLTPGNSAMSPGSPFNEPGFGSANGGTGGANYSPTRSTTWPATTSRTDRRTRTGIGPVLRDRPILGLQAEGSRVLPAATAFAWKDPSRLRLARRSEWTRTNALVTRATLPHQPGAAGVDASGAGRRAACRRARMSLREGKQHWCRGRPRAC
jgi:hypothetical protein